MPPVSTAAHDSDDVRAAASGDRHAFQRLYQLHEGRVYGELPSMAG